jgi:hypothetical protein
VTKRQRRIRIREVEAEVLERLRKHYPEVELTATEELPSGTFILHLYAPYEDKMAILEAVSPRLVEIIDEGLDVMVLPESYKPEFLAA